MINLETLFKNHLNTNRISDDDMKKFAETNLQRMSSNNGGGEFTQMITDTTAAYTAYYGSIMDGDTKYTIQQGLTVTMNNAVEAFKDAVSKKALHLVLVYYPKESAEYQEFFPEGAAEYSGATLKNIEQLMDRMVDATNRHVADLGIPFLTEMQGYANTFKAARQAQLAKIGEVKDSKVDSSTSRDALENELMKNILRVAIMYLGNVPQCMVFFDQSFIRDSGNGGDEEPETP